MKARLARKIIGQMAEFVLWNTNYMPYSKGQVEKAIRRQNIMSAKARESLVDFYCKD